MQEKAAERWLEITNKEARKIWARTDLTREEKEKASIQFRLDIEAARKPAPEIMAERLVIDRHKRLDGFYKQHYRYLPEFEQAYSIFQEEGLADNPIRLAHTMVGLERYFVASRQANQHDPGELHQHFRGLVEGKKGNHHYTNQQFLDRSFHWIVNTITYEYNFLPDETLQAERIAKRLVEEIPAEGFLYGRRIRLLARHRAKDATRAEFTG